MERSEEDLKKWQLGERKQKKFVCVKKSKRKQRNLFEESV